MALFLKSAAKLLRQTAKTCQYLKKKAKKVHFFENFYDVSAQNILFCKFPSCKTSYIASFCEKVTANFGRSFLARLSLIARWN